MTKNRLFAIAASLAAIMISLVSCNDTTSNIGPSLIDDSVVIHKDSDFLITGKSLKMEDMDTRSSSFLLGRLNIPGYGKLNCSFVAQLLSATAMNIPDSITADSVAGMKMTIHFTRNSITGDSLAPNRLSAYQLTKQIPADIQSNFDPTGYYDPNPIGSHSYNASALGMNDTLYLKDKYGHLRMDLPRSLALKFFNQYRNDPSVFQWPATFKEFFPGIFVENSFGSGSLINIVSVEMPMYYTYPVITSVKKDSVYTKVPISHTDSVVLFATAPEVLASTNFNYEADPSIEKMVNEGNVISVAPCGYIPEITIPMDEVVMKYKENKTSLSMINNLVLTIPTEKISTEYGLKPPTTLLLVRKCDYQDFFANNSLPDNTKKTFWASYNSSTGSYTFTSMRQFILDIINEGGNVSDDDKTFYVVPVDITSETNTLYKETYVTQCVPAVASPTLVKLSLEDAKLMLTFSAISE